MNSPVGLFGFLSCFILMLSSYSAAIEQNEFVNVGKCLNAIIQSESYHNQQFILVGDEINNYKLNNTVYALPWPRTILATSILKDTKLDMRGFFLLFPDANSSNYELFLEGFSSRQSVKYVVYTESVLSVFHLFELFWQFKILDVIVLYRSQNDIITVFTYTPFTKRSCNNDSPVRINKWLNAEGHFETKGNLFSRKKKVFDLHGCPVRAQKWVLEKFPSERAGTPISTLIFNFFEDTMNFSGVILDGEEMHVDKYMLAYMNRTHGESIGLIKGEVDVALGKFSTLNFYGPGVKGPLQNSIDCYTWAVPNKAGVSPSMWVLYIGEFELWAWIFIATLHCGATGFFYALCKIKMNAKDPFSRSLNAFSSVCFLLALTVKAKPVTGSLRMFYISFVLYCFVTNAAYQASMGSLFTAPPESMDLKNTEELLRTDLIMTGQPRMYYLLLSSNESTTIHNVLKRFRTINPGTFEEILIMIMTTRRFAVFQSGDTLRKLERIIKYNFNTSNAYFVMPSCLFSAFSSPFLLKTGSVMWEPFVTIGQTLVESGIIIKWEKTQARLDAYFFETALPDKKFKEYSLEQLTGGLMILACGYMISTAVFLAEILSRGLKYMNVESTAKTKHYRTKRTVRFVK